jgi:hypothetical protein
MQDLVAQGNSAQRIYEALVIQDIQGAADLFLPVYQQHDAIDGLTQNFGHDGFVSLEANPHLANTNSA